jgi:hypothetical protein
MKLPEWLFFWRPTVVQFRTGEYAIRIWVWDQSRFEFVDLRSTNHCSWSRESKYFSDCLSSDLDEVMDKFTRIVMKKQKTKKEKEEKKYTIIIQSPR